MKKINKLDKIMHKNNLRELESKIQSKELKFQIVLGILLVFLFGLVPLVFSQEFNVCCEKTLSGAWCQNTLEENCDNTYRITQTSCQATSFCKLGCCVDTDEGLCMENTPERVCEESNGTWFDDSECNPANVPQCNLGCCVLGDQASFVTLTRCKKLSGFYGLETDFRREIQDEASCILQAHLQDKGACVYEFEGQRTCKFTTRNVCMQLKGANITSETEFWKDYLCSADELATNCGPTTETMCIEGKDEVYFKDSCGNPANIYDSSKINNRDYWTKIVSKEDSCGANDEKGNANSRICGNCDYFKGSVCSKGNAQYGENFCKDINCYDTMNGNDYKNGESWCVYQANVGLGRDVVGSRHFRHVCINGEEIVEPCADFRNEICIENELQTDDGNFLEAACRINRWIDCVDQTNKDDCLNTDKRDCFWQEGVIFTGISPEERGKTSEKVFEGGNTGGFSGGITGSVIAGATTSDQGACIPTVPPGLKFWQTGDASSVCSLSNAVCNVVFEENIFGKEKCKSGCECLTQSWVEKVNDICTSLGDCGAYVNIAGEYTDEGVEWKINAEKQILSGILRGVRQKAGI